MPSPKAGDLKAGYTGLIIGAVVLFITMTAIVHFTNAHYAAEKPAAEVAK
ncbi:MAG: hypothetical protein H0U66_00785 [Gemmatimonadaceae bacterium]|nr:hypothetical protein [Gemmatimonadaceae bacterium]